MDTNRLIPLLSELAVFTCVVEAGGFSAAAQKLGVAPSSISRFGDTFGKRIAREVT